MQKSSVIPPKANWALVTLTTKSLPDEVVAIASSYTDNLRYGAQTPFNDQMTYRWEGGMWEYDAYHDSIITAGNGGTQPIQARFTTADGLGRPQTKGTGAPLSDPSSPLVFPRNSNRISGPESQSCAACHNLPRAGGGGDRVGDVFVMAQRFDFATFDRADSIPTRGAMDEAGNFATLQNIADERKTIGMFGSGYIEMLARQMTADLETICDRMPPGASASLASKGVSFGVIARRPDGTWDTSRVKGISALSLATTGANGFLSDSSVAVDVWSTNHPLGCGDQVLTVGLGSGAGTVKTLTDSCPACNGKSQIDNYNTSNACALSSLGNFQTIRINR